MKFKVFILNYLITIICGAFAIATYFMRDNPFDNFMATMWLIIAIAIPVLSDRHYITSFRRYNDHIEIRYLTSLLRSRTFAVSISTIESIELKSRHYLLIYPPALDIKQPGDWRRFYIIEKNMLGIIGHQLANMNSVKVQTS